MSNHSSDYEDIPEFTLALDNPKVNSRPRGSRGRFIKTTEIPPTEQSRPATPPTPTEPAIMATETQQLPLFFPELAEFAATADEEGADKPEKIDKFDGDNKKFVDFATAIDLRIIQHPKGYTTGKNRMALIAQHCTGRARSWCNAVLVGKRIDLRSNYPKFLSEFKKAFEDREFVTRMQDQYLDKHTIGSVANFATRFEEAAYALGYPSNVMAPQFLRHMKDEVQRALNRNSNIDRSDYEDVRQAAVRIDQNLFQERKLIKANLPLTTPGLPAARPTPSQAQQGIQNQYPRRSAPRAPLTDEEKDHRHKNKLCLYCGSDKHLVSKCELAAARATRLNNTATGDTDSLIDLKEETVRRYSPSLDSWRPTDFTPRTKSRPSLIVKGSVGGKHVDALVDSGAESNFINQDLLPSVEIQSSTPLNQPIIAADGHIIVSKEDTVLVDLECDIEDIGKGTFPFIPAPLKHQDIILGYPWLEDMNPHINWKTGKLLTKRKRPKKKPLIQTNPRIFLSAPIIAGERRAPRGLSNAKALAMAERHKKDELRRQCKKDRKATMAIFNRINNMAAHVRRFVRDNINKTKPEDNDSIIEDNTSPINWQQPWHALELNALLKANETPIEQVLPDHYKKFAEVFSKPKAEELAPRRPGLDHRIEFKPDAKIRRSRVYKMSDTELKLLKTYIEDGLRRGWIRRSKSPSASPVMFKTKPHDTALRLCVDYRHQNSNTIKNAYPLPIFDDFIGKMHGAKYFTKLDLRNAFHLLRIAEGDEWKTAFITQFGLYEYQVMPFGLCNAPASFQAWMDDIFRDLADTMMCYLDDILIWGNTKEELIEHVKGVLQILQNNGLYAKLEKCEFEVTTTWFLGYIIQHNCITVDPSRVALVSEWPIPKTLKQVQSFLGFINFYRRFIPRFSEIAYGLTTLTRKENLLRRFELGESGLKSFHALQDAFKDTKILHMWNPDLPAILETDASAYAIAGILSQVINGVKVPIGFYSKKHSPEESRYGTPDQELMAICYSLLHWRHYLEGAKHQITVLSDHANLTSFNTTANLNRRQAGYWSQMSRFDYIVKHIAGKTNPADLPSRREDYKPTKDDPAPEVHPFLQLAAMAQVPPDLYNALVTATASDDYALEVNPLDEESDLKWKDDLLIYADSRTYVPSSLRNRILELCHDPPLAGHQGQKRTYEKCHRDWYWPYMKEDIERYVRGCRNCNINKDTHHAAYGKLSPLPVPEGRWTRVHMDFITDLPTTLKGNNAIFVIIDAFTKMGHFIPVKLKGNDTINAKAAADIFRRECIRLHGIPGTIVSDRDTRFLNKFWKGITSKLGVIQQPTTAYHSLANGQAERANTTIEALLRAYCNEAQTDWDTWIDTCEFAYNDSQTSTTGTTPFFANYGYHPRRQSHPESLNQDPDSRNEGTVWAAKQQAVFDKCKEHLEKTRDNMAKYYDQRHSEMEFKVGDEVMLRTRHMPLQGDKSRKLAPRYIGPFPISKIEGPLTYRLNIPAHMKISHPVYHISNLEKYHTPDAAQGQSQAKDADTWIERVTKPIQHRTTPYRILACRNSQGGRQTHYKLEFLEDKRIVWAPRTFVGFVHSDDDIIDDFHTQHPDAPRPRGYILEADRIWEDIQLPDEEDNTPKRGRPKVQFTRQSNYAITATRPYGEKDLQYAVCNPERPSTTKWMTRKQLVKVLGKEGLRLVKDYTSSIAHGGQEEEEKGTL